MTLLDTLNFLLTSGSRTVLVVAVLPIGAWYLANRPRASWPYFTVLGLAIMSLVLTEAGEVLSAWWSSVDSGYADSLDWASSGLMDRLKLRLELVAGSAAISCLVFLLGSA